VKPNPLVQDQPKQAVVLASDLDVARGFKLGTVVPLELIAGGKIGNPEEGCSVLHLHHDPGDAGIGIKICDPPAGTYTDPNRFGCGYGPVVSYQTDIELKVEVQPAFVNIYVNTKITYKLTITNKGNLKVARLKIIARILGLDGLFFIGEVEPSVGCMQNDAGQTECTLEELAAGQSKEVLLSFTPKVFGMIEASFDALAYNVPCGNLISFPDPDLLNNKDRLALTFVGLDLPDFLLAFTEPTVTKNQDDDKRKVKVRLDIVRFLGFTGPVTIKPPSGPDLPEGIVIILDDPTIVTEDRIAIKIKVKDSVQPGEYPLTFSGSDSSGKTTKGTVILKVE